MDGPVLPLEGGDVNGASFFAIVKQDSEFSLGGTGHCFTQDLAHNVDGTIVGWGWGVIRQSW